MSFVPGRHWLRVVGGPVPLGPIPVSTTFPVAPGRLPVALPFGPALGGEIVSPTRRAPDPAPSRGPYVIRPERPRPRPGDRRDWRPPKL